MARTHTLNILHKTMPILALFGTLSRKQQVSVWQPVNVMPSLVVFLSFCCQVYFLVACFVKRKNSNKSKLMNHHRRFF